MFKKQNVLMSEDMLLKWFCDKRPSVTEAILFTDGVEKLILGIILRVDWNECMTSVGIVPRPDGREVGTKSLTLGRTA